MVTGEDFRSAASAIRDEIASIGQFPVIVSNAKFPTKRAWVDKFSALTRIVLLETDAEETVSCEDAFSVPAPLMASQLLSAVGMTQYSHFVGDAVVESDGSVSGLLMDSSNDCERVHAFVETDEKDVGPADRRSDAQPYSISMETIHAPEVQDDEDFDPWAPTPAAPAPNTHAAPVPPPPLYIPPAPTERPSHGLPQQPQPVSPAAPYAAPAPLPELPVVPVRHVPESVLPQPAPRRAARAPRDYSERPAAPVVRRVEPSIAPPAPPAAFVPAGRHTVAPAPEDSDVDLFATHPAKVIAKPAVTPAGRSPLLIVWGATGGVGKTTLALSLAERAAAAGKKVILIDGNRGQGDIRTYLRLTNKSLPTIFDTTLGHEANSVIVSPRSLKDARAAHEGVLHFALVQAPTERHSDPAIVGGDVYNAVINAARNLADLVIVDTQVVERFDTSGLVGTIITPSLARGAYSIAVTDHNPAGTTNLINRLTDFTTAGAAHDRMFVVVNRVPDLAVIDETKMTQVFGKTASYLGAIETDNAITATMNSGNVPTMDGAGSKIIEYVLWQVTKDSRFDQSAVVQSQPARRRLFGKG